MGIKNQTRLPKIDIFSEPIEFYAKKPKSPLPRGEPIKIADSKPIRKPNPSLTLNEELLEEPEIETESKEIETKKERKKRKPIKIIVLILVILGFIFTYSKKPEYINMITENFRKTTQKSEIETEKSDYLNLKLNGEKPIAVDENKEYLEIPKDLKKGKYLLVNTDEKEIGYYEISTSDKWDAPPSALKSIGQVNTFGFVEVNDGEFLKTKNLKIYLADNISLSPDKNGEYYTGMYRVGKDIPTGKYEIVSENDTNDLTIDIFNKDGELKKSLTNKEKVQLELQDNEQISFLNGVMKQK